MKQERVEQPERPVLVFDGDCGFCRRSIAWLVDRAGPTFEPVAAGELGERLPQVDRVEAGEKLIHVDTDGSVQRAFAACCRTLADIPGHGLPWFLYRFLPGYGRLGEVGYRFIAAHRGQSSRVLDVLAGPRLLSTWNVGRRLFVLWLGLVHAVWFRSLFGQLDLLIGSEGLLPLGVSMDGARAQGVALWDMPTIFRLGGVSWLPWFTCGAGVVTGVVLATGRLPRWCLVILYVCQLSLMQAGGVFMLHEGDGLLLEATLLALLLVPGGARPDWSTRILPVGRWLLLFLLVRALALPAFAQLGHAAEWFGRWLPTQPLPSSLALSCTDLPHGLLAAVSVTALAVAAFAPLLLFTFRRLRLFAVLALGAECVALSVLGTHGVTPLVLFGLLLLCVDDGTWLRLLPLLRRFCSGPLPQRGLGLLVHGIAALLLFSTAVTALVAPTWKFTQVLPRFGLAGFYGDLTRDQEWRPVLVVQAGDDGVSWHPYETRYHPGRADRTPDWAMGKLPRLDHALALAALFSITGSEPPWLGHLAVRLLQGNQEAEAAFAEVPRLAARKDEPFPRPPDLLRFMLYRYDPARGEQRAEGLWWQRRELERVGPQYRLGK